MNIRYSLSLLVAALALILVSSCNKNNYDSGVRGNVAYGEGDCMPGIGRPEKKYWSYKGDLYFVVKSKLDTLGNGDLEALKKRSLKAEVRGGKLSIALPPNTYVVLPGSFYVTNNVVVVAPGQVLERDLKFWKCTSY